MLGCRKLANAITAINKWIFTACTVIVFIIVVLISFEVFCRYALNAPTVWAMELSTMLFGPYFMLAGAYLLHVQGHVNVDIVATCFSSGIQRGIYALSCLIIASLCGIFVWQSYPLAIEAYRYGETSFTSWNPVVWPIKFTIPVSLTLVMLQALAELYYAFNPQKEAAV